MKLGRLKALREASGFTQKELASHAHVSEWSVVRAEHGEEVRPNTARRYAEVLDVAVADLMEAPPVPFRSVAPEAEEGSWVRRIGEEVLGIGVPDDGPDIRPEDVVRGEKDFPKLFSDPIIITNMTEIVDRIFGILVAVHKHEISPEEGRDLVKQTFESRSDPEARKAMGEFAAGMWADAQRYAQRVRERRRAEN
jgi:DNA-binding XRE family transcriptional regulator